MAAPRKSSLPYFPHDTDSRGDRKLKLLTAQTGMIGFGTYWALLEDVYNNGYYLPWSEEDRYLFVDEFSKPGFELTHEQLDKTIEKLCHWGLFNETIFTEHKVFTSASIQRRYLKASERRQLAEIKQSLLLINMDEFYKEELETKTLSVKIVGENGQTVALYGDYEESSPTNGINVNNNGGNVDNNVDNSEAEEEYEEKYDFDSTHKWDGKQPIDYAGCVEVWNNITGANSRVTDSKRGDLRRVFRNYIGRECLNAMIVRAEDETLSKTKYLTDWSTLFGAKKLENLDKWVGRGREWMDKNQEMETVDDHKEAGWMSQRAYSDLCEEAGVDFENPIYCDTKKVENTILYYPKFNY